MSRHLHAKIANAPLSFTPARNILLQRKCACGGNVGSDGECEECRKRKLQRKARSSEPGTQNNLTVPPIGHEVRGHRAMPTLLKALATSAENRGTSKAREGA